MSSSVDIVPKKKVVSERQFSTYFENFKHVIELSMDIPNDSDG